MAPAGPSPPAAPKTLLIVGPQPPPLGGATLTMRALLDELACQAQVRAAVVDTGFATAYSHRRPRPVEAARRASLILRRYAAQVPACDAVLVFGNNGLIAALLLPLLALARLYRKPLFLKPIGGDLDLFLAAQPRPVRAALLRGLRAADGLLAQTQHLCRALAQYGCARSHYVPGWRPAGPAGPAPARAPAAGTRLIYLSQIKPEKGVFVLLEALGRLAAAGGPPITCDLYGPIYETCRAPFEARLAATPGARYCGAAAAGAATALIGGYDVLVLPTFFRSEGHPGVLLEAMHAGVPVISTAHRAIPELVRHEENGLLVPPQDSPALAAAIRQLALDPAQRTRLGAANYRRGQDFRADVVVPRLLALIFNEKEATPCTHP